MSIKIPGYEYKDTIRSSNGLIAEIHKSERTSLYWIRFLEEVDGGLDLITVRIRNGGLPEIKNLIREELFAEVEERSKTLEAVKRFKSNTNNKTEVNKI